MALTLTGANSVTRLGLAAPRRMRPARRLLVTRLSKIIFSSKFLPDQPRQRAKLAALQRKPAANRRADESSVRLLTQTINQMKEEMTRFESRVR
jgi:hypothetical protein